MIWTIEKANGWPFPRATELRRARAGGGGAVWLEISAEDADNLLNAVPPIYVRHGFMVGEIADHSPRGNIHATVLNLPEWEGCYFLAELAQADLEEATAGLLAALDTEVSRHV